MGRILTGDVVSLRCGGIEMVVINTPLLGQIGVAWIDTRGQARRGVFPSSALRVLRTKDDV